jgi:hypothetical protein
MSEPWITISVLGTTIGTTVASMTFVAAHTSSKALATGANYGITFLGEVASMGATAWLGQGAGISVRMFSKTAAYTTDEVIQKAGFVTAGVAAAVAGATTALSISVGERVIHYSVEHGGAIGKELAEKIAEAYLLYRGHKEIDQEWIEL